MDQEHGKDFLTHSLQYEIQHRRPLHKNAHSLTLSQHNRKLEWYYLQILVSSISPGITKSVQNIEEKQGRGLHEVVICPGLLGLEKSRDVSGEVLLRMSSLFHLFFFSILR